ncbi:hypothetical protein Bca4012_070503 [Brassica carinata]|uniref:Protein kinase domain-containing protein n=1 Tax=Brassica carinata TaxID=52824 RepID=A0A8X7U8J0_BRACI|nr:hypothetical protein Bca52824_062771 [Brassica carinata]
MKTFLLSSRNRNKKRKIIVATPRKHYDQFGSSLQIISQTAFEAAVNKLSTPVNASVAGVVYKSLVEVFLKREEKNYPKLLKLLSVSSSWDRSICLGEGAHGVVYLVIRNNYVNGDTLPLKIAIKSAPISSSFSLCDEERILKDLSSPHLISCYGSNITPAETQPLGSDYNVILEYCSGGSIADFLKFRGVVRMMESDVQIFSLHILKGINYVHSKKIIHCDIKPANILLKPVNSSSIVGCLMPTGFEPKLADFGLALRKTSDEYGDGCGFARGTLLYMLSASFIFQQ